MNYALIGLQNCLQTAQNILKQIAKFPIWLIVALYSSWVQVFKLPKMILEYWGGKPELQGEKWLSHNSLSPTSNFTIVYFTELGNRCSKVSYTPKYPLDEGVIRIIGLSIFALSCFFGILLSECDAREQENKRKQESQRQQIEEKYSKEHPTAYKVINVAKDTVDYVITKF